MSLAPTAASVPPRRPDRGGEDPSAHLVETLAAAVLATPGVAGLHGGRFGEVGTYLPGRRVVGVRLDAGRGPGDRPGRGTVEVHVVVEPSSLPGVGDVVRRAVRPLVGDRVVDVVVADVHDPREEREVAPTPAEPETGRSDGREEQTP